MPGGDRTGPAGMGPMTGRAAGYCAGYSAAGYMNPVGGQGFGGGFGRGRGMGRGLGRGMWRGMGVGFAQGPVPTPQPIQPMTNDDELAMLKQQAEAVTQQMRQIQERIAGLEQRVSVPNDE